MRSYENYAKIRDSMGMRDADVCRGAGISSATMSEWKNNKYEPKRSKMEKIAHFFGVPTEYLLTGKPVQFIEDEATQLAQYVFQNKSIRLLIDAAKNSNEDCIRLATEMLKRMQ